MTNYNMIFLISRKNIFRSLVFASIFSPAILFCHIAQAQPLESHLLSKDKNQNESNTSPKTPEDNNTNISNADKLNLIELLIDLKSKMQSMSEKIDTVDPRKIVTKYDLKDLESRYDNLRAEIEKEKNKTNTDLRQDKEINDAKSFYFDRITSLFIIIISLIAIGLTYHTYRFRKAKESIQDNLRETEKIIAELKDKIVDLKGEYDFLADIRQLAQEVIEMSLLGYSPGSELDERILRSAKIILNKYEKLPIYHMANAILHQQQGEWSEACAAWRQYITYDNSENIHLNLAHALEQRIANTEDTASINSLTNELQLEYSKILEKNRKNYQVKHRLGNALIKLVNMKAEKGSDNIEEELLLLINAIRKYAEAYNANTSWNENTISLGLAHYQKANPRYNLSTSDRCALLDNTIQFLQQVKDSPIATYGIERCRIKLDEIVNPKTQPAKTEVQMKNEPSPDIRKKFSW
ncbi:hypothetical protein DesfrDRAFT_3571 [Solidesulfovibrio fructosivorans JJ]]|uniref:Tetratricopeptide repeat protein n=2 Tax=Solidesulfovibrio fructosivorans TaxID=878 RepID=E1K121_SOLFR|nr:hypothetical protein DesfrDRAFT_3571 [Solidesulfovibrio fructosivorans JJ]]